MFSAASIAANYGACRLGTSLRCPRTTSSMPAVTNMLQELLSASSSALPLAVPSVGANHLDMSMSATTSLSSDMGALQQHDPTMTQMILGMQRYLELDTLGTLSGNVFTGEAPNHTVDDWRQSVTRDVREHIVCKLVQVIYVSAGSVSSYDERFLIVQYAQKVERKKYELANSREEYYHLLAERFYKIQVDPKEKLLSKLGISSAHSFSLESTSHTAEDWRQSVAQDLRQHLVLGLIQRMCPSLDPTSLLDMQIMSLVQHARKVERDTYEMATNLEEYYDLLADKIYDTQKDLEEKQKGRKQQRNDVLVQKMRVLRQELHALQPQSDYCCIEISRDEVFEGSYRYIMMIKPEDLRKRLMVMFEGEEGVDYGGIAREWLYLLSHEILNPSYGLFQYSHDDIYTLQINPDSGVNPLLGKRITLDDLESVDPVLHRSLVWILDNDITGIIDHSFCVDHEAYGERIMHDLKPDGKDIPVTGENKKEYVKLYVNWRFMRGIETQFLALQKGFSELIPQHLLQPFDERELELVISGIGKIDVEDWKKNTCLEECTTDSDIVKWFWQAVEEFDEERRGHLLQFVTGNSRVPLQGFKALQGSTQSQETGLFTIHQVDTDTDSLPNAHTCFNLIEIPPYESYEKFLDKLTCAVEETCGFTFE